MPDDTHLRQNCDAPANQLEREVVSLYESHASELLAYAVTIVGNDDRARDGVQETFLRYFVERSYGRQLESPRAWLYRVLHNLLLDQLDSAAMRHEALSGDAGSVPDPRHGPEARIRQAQTAEEITALLSPRELEVVRLRADGLSYAEIAEVLSLRPGTVSALLTRAHIKLRNATEDSSSQRWNAAEALYYLFIGGESYSP